MTTILLVLAALAVGFAVGARWSRRRSIDYYREQRWLRKLSTGDRVMTGSSVRGEGVVRVVQAKVARRRNVDI